VNNPTETEEVTVSKIARTVSEFCLFDWSAAGAEEAANTEDCGYSYPNTSSTPWGDCALPAIYSELRDLLEEEDSDLLEELTEFAKDRFNSGYCAVEVSDREATLAEWHRRLLLADQQGFRICQFGLPGSNTWDTEIATSIEEANQISDRLFKPGPCGPYDSAILLPSQVAECEFADGTRPYGDLIEEILNQIKE